MALSEEEFGSLLAFVSRIESPDQMNRLREAFLARQQRIGRASMQKLRAGAQVSWTGKHGHQTGTVVKIKQKYVDVRVKTGDREGIWIVPASLLEVNK